jgi:hypothetical protein
MIVPGAGLSPGGTRWIGCRPGFFQHVRVLSRLFRHLFIEGLLALHHTGHLVFFDDHAGLAETAAFKAWLTPFRKSEWVVYAKPPFGGSEAVLAYLTRYTHRVCTNSSRRSRTTAPTNGAAALKIACAFRWRSSARCAPPCPS